MDDTQRRQRLAFLLADRDNCWARLDEATQVRIRAEGAVDGAQAVIDECRERAHRDTREIAELNALLPRQRRPEE